MDTAQLEPIGPKIRKQRRRLGLTLDELAGRTGISKPYLSLIETGRVPNPPSDEKLRRLEQTLGFYSGELLTHAHLQRTPHDVRAILTRLLASGGGGDELAGLESAKGAGAVDPRIVAESRLGTDPAMLSSVLRELIDLGVSAERVSCNAVPLMNAVSAEAGTSSSDEAPQQAAFIGCPDLQDAAAFAARVQGDAMLPNYRHGDIVIFSPARIPHSGDDCFVRFATGQTTFKRIFFETDPRERHPVTRLQPRNEKYPPIIAPSSEIAALYCAAWRYQRLNSE